MSTICNGTLYLCAKLGKMTQNSKSNNNKNGTTEFLVHYSTLSIFSMTKKLLQTPGLDVLYTFSIFEGYVVHSDENLGVAIVDSFKRGVFALLRLFVFKRP